MTVDGLLLDKENDVGESGIVDDGSHVNYQVCHCLVVYFVLL